MPAEDSLRPDAGSDAGGDASRTAAFDGGGDGSRDVAVDASRDRSLDAHTNTSLLDANLEPDAGDAASDASGWPPSAPSSFRIGVNGTPCFGSCPSYSLALDETGTVTYFGGPCAARPGAFTRQIAATDARMLYDALAMTQFWDLGERYQDEQDGCPMVWTDDRTLTWDVEIDGRSKMLAHYHGCQGLPELDRIDALEPFAFQVAGVDSWVHSTPSNCGGRGRAYTLSLQSSYRLSDEQQVLGVLVLDVDRESWALKDCTHAPLGEGTIIVDSDHWILLDGNERPIQLPDLGPVGSILIDEPEAQAPPRVRALRADDELTLTVSPGSGC